MYTYKQTESTLWTVGHYEPGNGKWQPESDHPSPELAADRVIVLNGGKPQGKSTPLQNSEPLIRSLVNALLEYEQSKQPVDVSMDEWGQGCFLNYYKGSTDWFYFRIAERLTAMINDPDYKVSETELIDFLTN